jgi:hypothetical protein
MDPLTGFKFVKMDYIFASTILPTKKLFAYSRCFTTRAARMNTPIPNTAHVEHSSPFSFDKPDTFSLMTCVWTSSSLPAASTMVLHLKPSQLSQFVWMLIASTFHVLE